MNDSIVLRLTQLVGRHMRETGAVPTVVYLGYHERVEFDNLPGHTKKMMPKNVVEVERERFLAVSTNKYIEE